MSFLKSIISLISLILLCIDAKSAGDLRSLQLLEDDSDDFLDPVILNPIQEVSVFEPGQDAFVTVPQGLIRNAMMTTYGSTSDTVQRREESMTRPLVNLYNDSLFDDLWIKEYGSSGTYQLSYPILVPQSEMIFVTRLTERCSYMSYFKENLLIVGAWSFCPGPPWRDDNLTEVHRFCFYMNYTIPPQPWINPNLGVPHSYPRGAVGSSQDGGKTWKIIVADPRLARLGSNLVIVNGSDGTNGAALCLVGGSILPPYQVFTHNSVFPITDSVLCSYDGITWWENIPLPTPSAEHSLVSIGSSILVVGGLRPRNMSETAALTVNTKFMAQPPILVSVLSSSPCNVGYPLDSGCVGYKGWAAFASPLAPSVNNLPRCNPLVLFSNDISIPGSVQNSFSPPKLLIGSGHEMYARGNPILLLDNFLDMYSIQNESLASNIINLAIKTLDLDPFGGTRDTFNTSSFVKLGDWVQDERELPKTQDYDYSFIHQIKFDPDADICLSNGIFPGKACSPNSSIVYRPFYVYIRGQSLYSDFVITTPTDVSTSPYKYFSVTQLLEDPDYMQDPYFRLETFYGQRVTTLPNYGSAFISFMKPQVTDSILISPSWNDGQPVILALQGGVRMQTIHFARCTFLNCKYGAAYPVTCQHNPRDSFCQPCESCTGNTSADGGTFLRKQCTYDVSDLSRIPIVTDTICETCTNCSSQDADYSQTCSAFSDAVCKTRTISPSNVPSPIASKPDEYWKTWLFRIIPLERQSGPFLERLRTTPLEIGGAILAVVTLAFVLSISWILTLSSSSSSSSNRNYKSTLSQISLSHENSTFKSHHIHITADEVTTIPTSESSVSYDSKNKVQPVSSSLLSKKHQLLKNACLAYTGILFFVTSTTFIVSLPLETLIVSLLFVIHSIFSLCGIFASGMLDMILDRGGKRRLAYSYLESSMSLESRRYLRLAEFIVLVLMICSPICINLVYFFPKDLIDIKQGEVFAYLFSFISGLFQLLIVCVSVYQNQLSLFLWPVSLSIIVTITSLICAGSVASNILSHYSTKSQEKSVKSSDSVTSVSTDPKYTNNNTISELIVTNSSGHETGSTDDMHNIVHGSKSSGNSTETLSISTPGVPVSSTVQNTDDEEEEKDDDDSENDTIDSKLVLDQLRNMPDLQYGEVVTSYSQQLEFEKDIHAILSENMQKQQAIKQSQIRRASAPAVV
jgi:hypothetical protein